MGEVEGKLSFYLYMIRGFVKSFDNSEDLLRSTALLLACIYVLSEEAYNIIINISRDLGEKFKVLRVIEE